MGPVPKNLSGMRFERWLVLKEAGRHQKHNYMLWECICDCGTVSLQRASSLKNGETLSCGCYHKEMNIKRLTKHGGSAGGKATPEYRSWMHMKRRCTDEKNDQYKDYGARGIKVCDRWLEAFENFLEDMGLRPTLKHTIERRDNDGNYEPSNCYWATKAEQSRNKRSNRYLEYNGERMVLRDWGARLGIHETSIHYHLKTGKSFKEVIEYFNNKKLAA